jgi:predicted ATP-dependent serine protease
MKCNCCEREVETRFGICWECANFESLVEDKIDMENNKIIKSLPNHTESINIVKAIIDFGKGIKK